LYKVQALLDPKLLIKILSAGNPLSSLRELGDLCVSQVVLLFVTSREGSAARRRHNEANGTPWHHNNSIQFNFVFIYV
jgi:hypothetical protein